MTVRELGHAILNFELSNIPAGFKYLVTSLVSFLIKLTPGFGILAISGLIIMSMISFYSASKINTNAPTMVKHITFEGKEITLEKARTILNDEKKAGANTAYYNIPFGLDFSLSLANTTNSYKARVFKDNKKERTHYLTVGTLLLLCIAPVYFVFFRFKWARLRGG